MFEGVFEEALSMAIVAAVVAAAIALGFLRSVVILSVVILSVVILQDDCRGDRRLLQTPIFKHSWIVCCSIPCG